MGKTIAGFFQTRRDAEMAVERLVQEHGVERTDVFIEPETAANTAGTVPAGADRESGHDSIEKEGEPALKGRIKVSVDLNAGDTEAIEASFREFGVADMSSS